MLVLSPIVVLVIHFFVLVKKLRITSTSFPFVKKAFVHNVLMALRRIFGEFPKQSVLIRVFFDSRKRAISNITGFIGALTRLETAPPATGILGITCCTDT